MTQQPTPPLTIHTLSPTPPAAASKPDTTVSNGLPPQTQPPKGYPPHPSLPPPNQRPRIPLHPSILPLLDPAYVDLYNNVMAYWPPSPTDITIVREHYSSLYRFAMRNPSGVGGIGETVVPGWSKYPGEISVRVYVPPGEELGTRKIWPVHFNFHGGGWAVGDLETSAHICHHICAKTPCCVVDVEYRLIPEYPFPVGIMDSLAAVAHVLANHKTFSIDHTNFTLGGESSGGTIALILNHVLRDAGLGEHLKGVVAGTPTISDVRKYATPEMSPWKSMVECQDAPGLNWEKLKWFDTFKWMSLSSSHPGVSAKEAKKDVSWFSDAMNAPSFDNLAGVTWVGTAGCDPLRDEAEAYAEKVRKGDGEGKGNRVVIKRYEGVPHGFVHMDGLLRQGQEYVDDVIAVIRECLLTSEEEGDTSAQNLEREADHEKINADEKARPDGDEIMDDVPGQ